MVRSLLLAAAALLSAAPTWAQTPDITDILTLREIGGYQSGIALSPDGRTVAVFTRDTLLDEDRYRYELRVVPTEGGDARVIADAGDAILRTGNGRFSGAIDDRIPAWSPDSASIAYIARHENRIELWKVRPDGDGNRRLVGGDRDVARFAWLNSREIVVTLYPSGSELRERAALAQRLGFFADDRFEPQYSLVPYPDLSRGQVTIVIDTRGRRLRDATADDLAALRPTAGYGASDGVVAFDQEGELRAHILPAMPGDAAARPGLALEAIREGVSLRCAAPECSGFMNGVWVADDDSIVFQRSEGHGRRTTALYRWSLGANTVRLLRRDDEALFDCENAHTALVCLHEAPTQPRRLVALSLTSGELTPLYDPNPQWAQFQTTRVDTLDVHDAYGNEGFAHLVWPRAYRPGQLYPMVIVQYRSRGFLRGGTGYEYPIHALAGRGYFVLSVDRTENLALEAQLPAAELQARTELDGSELRMKQTQLEALLGEISDRQIVDRERIAITGFSDGAETAFTMLTRTNLIAVAIVSNPPVDPSGYALASERFRRTLRDVGATAPWDDSSPQWGAWWRENSNFYQAEHIRAPLLMNLSDNEALTAFPLAVRLGELGRPVQIYIYPGEYHVKWRPQHQLALQMRTLDWLDFWLRGIERDDPNEPERLERWRELRARHDASAR